MHVIGDLSNIQIQVLELRARFKFIRNITIAANVMYLEKNKTENIIIPLS